MFTTETDNLDLYRICNSGQCFRFKALSDGVFAMTASDAYAEARLDGKRLVMSCDEEEFDSFWKHYFDLDSDYDTVEGLMIGSGDGHMIEAYEEGRGIRILNQNLWEMIVSYIVSQNNNIPRIRGSIERIALKGGYTVKRFSSFTHKDISEMPADSPCIYRIPEPGEVPPDFFDDASLGLGYRNIYLKEMYDFADKNKDWLAKLGNAGYGDARKMLLERLGIGPKVADCICLFGLHHVEAFPIDTHVRQLLSKYYPDGFDFGYFDGCAGTVQQYLFYFELVHAKDAR